MNSGKIQSVHYLSPRLGIFIIGNGNKSDLLQIQIDLKARHKTYFHIFNLTSLQFAHQSNLGSRLSYTNFKWRQIPFSITETIKILASIQNYQIKNLANAAILAVPDKSSFQFCLFVTEVYSRILGIGLGKYKQKQHTISQFMKIYKTIDIKNPPVKIIQSLSFRHHQSSFIPIPVIFTESRHNSFQEVYVHKSQSELTQYYIDKKRPVGQGIGLKYCERKPETKHFSKPVIVFGDVRIEVYSFDSLKLERQFICGFNTKAMEYEQTLIQLKLSDLYEVRDLEKMNEQEQILIEVTDYCEACKDEAKCGDCLQIIKKISSSYKGYADKEARWKQYSCLDELHLVELHSSQDFNLIIYIVSAPSADQFIATKLIFICYLLIGYRSSILLESC